MMKGRSLVVSNLPELILLTGCILVLQYHSVQFWQVESGRITGWAWSILLEGSALWLWASKKQYMKLLGLVSSMLVLLGPTYQVTSPLFHEWANVDKHETYINSKVVTLRSNIEATQNTLNTYLHNSENRVGWAHRIDAEEEKLDNLRSQLVNTEDGSAQSSTKRLTWQRIIVIAMQAIALMLFQIVNVLCITTIVSDKRMNKHKTTRRKAQNSVSKKTVTTAGNARKSSLKSKKHEEQVAHLLNNTDLRKTA